MVNVAAAEIGCVVEFVEHPEVGLAALCGLRPVAFIVDVFMPRISTVDFLREARSIYPDVPVILITAVPKIEEHAKALKAVAYLAKPFSIDAFKRIDRETCPPFRKGASITRN